MTVRNVRVREKQQTRKNEHYDHGTYDRGSSRSRRCSSSGS
jgi:hypothetical protein